MLDTLSTIEESNPTPINVTTSPATTPARLQLQHDDEDPVLRPRRFIDKIVDVLAVLQRPVPWFQKAHKLVEITHVQFLDKVVDVPVMERQRRPSAPRMSYNTQYTDEYECERRVAYAVCCIPGQMALRLYQFDNPLKQYRTCHIFLFF